MTTTPDKRPSRRAAQRSCVRRAREHQLRFPLGSEAGFGWLIQSMTVLKSLGAKRLVAGIVGRFFLGLLADHQAFTPEFMKGASAPKFGEGALTGGGFGGGALFWDQLVSMGFALVYSFIVTWVLAKVVDRVIGLRVDENTERAGLDVIVHAEAAYN